MNASKIRVKNQTKAEKMKKILLMVMLLTGMSMVLNAGSEVKLLGEACDGGYAAKCYDLGVIYRDGRRINKDTLKARELFQKACDGGDTRGCTELVSESAAGAQGMEGASSDCPRQAFKQYAEKLDKTKIEFVDRLKGNYKEVASRQSSRCKSLLFGDFRYYYDQMMQAYIASAEKRLNEKYPLSAKKEKEYKAEFKKVGLRLDQSEGLYYVEADSAWFSNEFASSLSDDWKKYLKQSDYEAKNSVAEDAVLQISFEELRKRIIFWENFLYDYPAFTQKSKVEELLSDYLSFYVSDFESALNFSHIPISSDDIRRSYENFMRLNSKSKYYDIVKSQYAIIKANAFKIDKKSSKKLNLL